MDRTGGVLGGGEEWQASIAKVCKMGVPMVRLLPVLPLPASILLASPLQ